MKIMDYEDARLVLIITLAAILVFILFIGYIESKKPVYTVESYKEPVYGTLYYGTLTKENCHWYGYDFTTYNFDNTVSYTTDISGTGCDGKDTYTFITTDYSGNKLYYYQISKWNVNEKAGIVRYDTRTRQICVKNCN